MKTSISTKPLGQRVGLQFGDTEKPVLEALKVMEDSLTNDSPGPLTEASQAFQALAKTIKAHGGAGHVTIKIAAKMDGGKLRIVSDVTHKLPKPKRQPSTAYVLPDGSLTLTDPAQLEMDMDIVE